jgi:hypothetical protein
MVVMVFGDLVQLRALHVLTTHDGTKVGVQ